MSKRNFTRARPTPRRGDEASLRTVVERCIGRRSLLKAGLAAGVASGAMTFPVWRPAEAAEGPSSLTFKELGRVTDETDHWPEGYERQILIRWGDPIFADAPEFDPRNQTGSAQARQFGTDNDFTAYLPLPLGSESSDHGLLVVSHEDATPYMMFDGVTADDFRERLTDEQLRAVKNAVGLSVIEVRKTGREWQVVKDGAYNRRVTLDTPIRLSGPCAGDARMCTQADPEGRTVLGTLTNCNGGVTPWGTILSGEEGGMDAFVGDYAVLDDQAVVERQGWDEDENDELGLSRIDPRFDFGREPNEWNRFDWVVELDPFDPESMPVKRTALGRFTHEGAQVILNGDGRVVVYMGDDDDFEYLYRFVTRDRYDPDDRAANRDLLDHGTLSVAHFAEDGTVEWRPLVHGEGPLTEANGFASQADVLFKTRMAADRLGATPMDGPEGFVPNPVTGTVFVALTEGEDRLPAGEGDAREQVNAANPRAENIDGHILELIPPGGRGADADHTADRYIWSIFALCGDPADPSERAWFHPETSENGWFTDPDNLSVDPQGRLWVCTDGPPEAGFNDGLYAVDVEGEGRALPKLFYLPPMGGECCSPAFTPDGRTLFVSIQHPGELRWSDMDDAESLAEAGSRWPDFDDAPPRGSVIVLTRSDGGTVGS